MPDALILSQRINLANVGSTTPAIAVPLGAAKVSIDINDDTDTYSWGNAVVDLQFTVAYEYDDQGTDITNWQNFSPVVQFDSSTKVHLNIRVSTRSAIRLKVTTSDSGADINAIVSVRTNWTHA